MGDGPPYSPSHQSLLRQHQEHQEPHLHHYKKTKMITALARNMLNIGTTTVRYCRHHMLCHGRGLYTCQIHIELAPFWLKYCIFYVPNKSQIQNIYLRHYKVYHSTKTNYEIGVFSKQKHTNAIASYIIVISTCMYLHAN